MVILRRADRKRGNKTGNRFSAVLEPTPMTERDLAGSEFHVALALFQDLAYSGVLELR
jgi:hypothetical protein